MYKYNKLLSQQISSNQKTWAKKTYEIDVKQKNINDLNTLLSKLPEKLRKEIEKHNNFENLIEITMDKGGFVILRFSNTDDIDLNYKVTKKDLDHMFNSFPITKFNKRNRIGLDGTLHRISAVKNIDDQIVGLTLRIGKIITNSSINLEHLLKSNKSILIIGTPGKGKTTILRDIAYKLSVNLHRRVDIVDKSSEIGGFGDIPHPAIGRARRFQVPRNKNQKDIMIEVVENHTPKVLVIDEISDKYEVDAAQTISSRTERIIATVHGDSIEDFVNNEELRGLIGKTNVVTLGDDVARKKGVEKTAVQRVGHPIFDVVVVIKDFNTVEIYYEADKAVDAQLANKPVAPEIRTIKKGISIINNGKTENQQSHKKTKKQKH